VRDNPLNAVDSAGTCETELERAERIEERVAREIAEQQNTEQQTRERRLRELKERTTSEDAEERQKLEEEDPWWSRIVEKTITFYTGCVAGAELGAKIGAAYGEPGLGALGGCITAGTFNATEGTNPVEPWAWPP
jgi:hypothetical protein